VRVSLDGDVVSTLLESTGWQGLFGEDVRRLVARTALFSGVNLPPIESIFLKPNQYRTRRILYRCLLSVGVEPEFSRDWVTIELGAGAELSPYETSLGMTVAIDFSYIVPEKRERMMTEFMQYLRGFASETLLRAQKNLITQIFQSKSIPSEDDKSSAPVYWQPMSKWWLLKRRSNDLLYFTGKLYHSIIDNMHVRLNLVGDNALQIMYDTRIPFYGLIHLHGKRYRMIESYSNVIAPRGMLQPPRFVTSRVYERKEMLAFRRAQVTEYYLQKLFRRVYPGAKWKGAMALWWPGAPHPYRFVAAHQVTVPARPFWRNDLVDRPVVDSLVHTAFDRFISSKLGFTLEEIMDTKWSILTGIQRGQYRPELLSHPDIQLFGRRERWKMPELEPLREAPIRQLRSKRGAFSVRKHRQLLEDYLKEITAEHERRVKASYKRRGKLRRKGKARQDRITTATYHTPQPKSASSNRGKRNTRFTQLLTSPPKHGSWERVEVKTSRGTVTAYRQKSPGRRKK
jgi:hypothetical protein